MRNDRNVKVIHLARSALTIALCLYALTSFGAGKPTASRFPAFSPFGLNPKSQTEAEEEYWRLRGVYSRTDFEHDDILHRTLQPKHTEEAKIRDEIYSHLDAIYTSVYHRTPPWPIHSLGIALDPSHFDPKSLLVMTYEPHYYEQSARNLVPEVSKLFYVGNNPVSGPEEGGAFHVRKSEIGSLKVWEYENLKNSAFADELLFGVERNLEIYVQKKVVSAAVVAKMRRKEELVDLGRTVHWSFVDPGTHEPLYHFRIQDASREVNPVKKGWWIFKPSAKKLRLNVEMNNPELVLPERKLFGETAKLIEIQKLFKDPNVEGAVEAGFSRAARLIKALHANSDGTFPPEVMIYGETTLDLVPLYRDKYGFDILPQTKQGTWIIKITPESFYEKYGSKDVNPSLRFIGPDHSCGRHFLSKILK